MAAAMDERVQIDSKLSVNESIVKHVVRQMVSGVPTPPSVQAVIPRALLETGAFPPSVAPLLESVQVGTTEGARRKTRHGMVPGRRGGAPIPSRWRGLSSKEVQEQITALVTHSVRQLLDDAEADEEVDSTMPLMEMGLDSLAATQLVRELSEGLDVQVSPTVLFDYPTIDALSKHLTSLLNVEGTNQADMVESGRSQIGMWRGQRSTHGRE